jgi:hypothetical protein
MRPTALEIGRRRKPPAEITVFSRPPDGRLTGRARTVA